MRFRPWGKAAVLRWFGGDTASDWLEEVIQPSLTPSAVLSGFEEVYLQQQPPPLPAPRSLAPNFGGEVVHPTHQRLCDVPLDGLLADPQCLIVLTEPLVDNSLERVWEEIMDIAPVVLEEVLDCTELPHVTRTISPPPPLVVQEPPKATRASEPLYHTPPWRATRIRQAWRPSPTPPCVTSTLLNLLPQPHPPQPPHAFLVAGCEAVEDPTPPLPRLFPLAVHHAAPSLAPVTWNTLLCLPDTPSPSSTLVTLLPPLPLPRPPPSITTLLEASNPLCFLRSTSLLPVPPLHTAEYPRYLPQPYRLQGVAIEELLREVFRSPDQQVLKGCTAMNHEPAAWLFGPWTVPKETCTRPVLVLECTTLSVPSDSANIAAIPTDDEGDMDLAESMSEGSAHPRTPSPVAVCEPSPRVPPPPRVVVLLPCVGRWPPTMPPSLSEEEAVEARTVTFRDGGRVWREVRDGEHAVREARLRAEHRAARVGVSRKRARDLQCHFRSRKVGLDALALAEESEGGCAIVSVYRARLAEMPSPHEFFSPPYLRECSAVTVRRRDARKADIDDMLGARPPPSPRPPPTRAPSSIVFAPGDDYRAAPHPCVSQTAFQVAPLPFHTQPDLTTTPRRTGPATTSTTPPRIFVPSASPPVTLPNNPSTPSPQKVPAQLCPSPPKPTVLPFSTPPKPTVLPFSTQPKPAALPFSIQHAVPLSDPPSTSRKRPREHEAQQIHPDEVRILRAAPPRLMVVTPSGTDMQAERTALIASGVALGWEGGDYNSLAGFLARAHPDRGKVVLVTRDSTDHLQHAAGVARGMVHSVHGNDDLVATPSLPLCATDRDAVARALLLVVPFSGLRLVLCPSVLQRVRLLVLLHFAAPVEFPIRTISCSSCPAPSRTVLCDVLRTSCDAVVAWRGTNSHQPVLVDPTTASTLVSFMAEATETLQRLVHLPSTLVTLDTHLLHLLKTCGDPTTAATCHVLLLLHRLGEAARAGHCELLVRGLRGFLSSPHRASAPAECEAVVKRVLQVAEGMCAASPRMAEAVRVIDVVREEGVVFVHTRFCAAVPHLARQLSQRLAPLPVFTVGLADEPLLTPLGGPPTPLRLALPRLKGRGVIVSNPFPPEALPYLATVIDYDPPQSPIPGVHLPPLAKYRVATQSLTLISLVDPAVAAHYPPQAPLALPPFTPTNPHTLARALLRDGEEAPEYYRETTEVGLVVFAASEAMLDNKELVESLSGALLVRECVCKRVRLVFRPLPYLCVAVGTDAVVLLEPATTYNEVSVRERVRRLTVCGFPTVWVFVDASSGPPCSGVPHDSFVTASPPETAEAISRMFLNSPSLDPLSPNLPPDPPHTVATLAWENPACPSPLRVESLLFASSAAHHSIPDALNILQHTHPNVALDLRAGLDNTKEEYGNTEEDRPPSATPPDPSVGGWDESEPPAEHPSFHLWGGDHDGWL